MAYQRQAKKSERNGSGIPVNMNYMTDINPKDIRKMLNKTLKSDKKYSEIATDYIHRKRNKELVARILKQYVTVI